MAQPTCARAQPFRGINEEQRPNVQHLEGKTAGNDSLQKWGHAHLKMCASPRLSGRLLS